MNENFVLGSIESPSDPRDYTYDDLCMSTEENIPNEYNLDWSAYKILNQGNIGSCKANALSMIKTYIDGNTFDNRYSVGWIYGNRYSSDHQGTGLISRETLKHLVNEGICLNNTFPINEEYPNIVSTIEKYGKDKLTKEANKHKSLSYIRLSKDDIKSYLYNYKKPILIDVYVYDNFYQASINGGIIPTMPTGNKCGGHSMIIIGYKNDMLKIVNSWGDTRGDNGFYYLDLNSPIIKELWSVEDTLNVNRPIIKTGWEKIECPHPSGTQIKWKYIKQDGTYAKNEWIQINSDWFYIGDDNFMYEMKWILYKDEYYFLGENGYMYHDKWILWTDRNWYYLLSNGEMATNTVINGYKINENGAWIE